MLNQESFEVTKYLERTYKTKLDLNKNTAEIIEE